MGSTIFYFCSQFSKTTPSLPEALTQLLFFLPVSPLSGCSTTFLKYPSGKHPGLGYFKDSQNKLGPELGQTETTWKASADTRNQWKQKEEGKRRSCNSRSWTSEERQCQVHRWVPVRTLPGQKRRWEQVLCQDLHPVQPHPTPTLPAISIWLPTTGLDVFLLWVPMSKNGGRWIILLGFIRFTSLC